MRFLVVGMNLGGMNAEEIADSLMIPRRTVSFWLHNFHHRGDVEDDSRSGRPRSTSNTADRRLLRLCRSDRFASSAMLLSDWGENVTERTVRRRLNAAVLLSRKTIQSPKLSPNHQKAHLKRAMARCHFREPHWSRIIFTDESRFRLHPVDGRVRVWRETTERHSPACVKIIFVKNRSIDSGQELLSNPVVR